MEHHPNFIDQLAEIEQRKIDKAQARADRLHLEALTENVRRNIHALLSDSGFELAIDHWGDGGIILEHVTSDGRYDYEIPLGD